MADATQSITDRMKEIQGLKSNNTDLNAILRNTEAETHAQLVDASQRTAYLQEYMTLNSALAKQINVFLEKNQNYKEKFAAMIKEPSKSGLGRLLRATPVLKVFGKADYLNPQAVADVIMDMYTNMILQKDAVRKQLSIIESRREDLLKQSSIAVSDLKVSSQQFEDSDALYTQLTEKKKTIDALVTQEGKIDGVDLSTVKDYYGSLDIKDPATVKRINIVKLQEVSDAVDKQFTQVEEMRRKYEIDMNSAKSAIPAYKLQQEQFNAYIKTTSVLLYGIESHLKYSKTIVENQAILAQSQEIAIKATKAFYEYQDAINQTFVLNAIGVQVMAQQTADLLNRETFDSKSIEIARGKVQDAKNYWDTFQKEYDNKALDMLKKLKEAQEPTTHDASQPGA